MHAEGRAHCTLQGHALISTRTARFNSQALMDLASTLQQLYAKKTKMERAIAALEELPAPSVSDEFQSLGGKRRGRKSMPANERQEVSQRMRRYWANRRKQQREKT